MICPLQLIQRDFNVHKPGDIKAWRYFGVFVSRETLILTETHRLLRTHLKLNRNLGTEVKLSADSLAVRESEKQQDLMKETQTQSCKLYTDTKSTLGEEHTFRYDLHFKTGDVPKV